MRKWEKWIKRFHIPSGGAILHWGMVEIVGQVLWWGVGKVFSVIPDIVKGVGFLVIFIAIIFAVAWYLPKLSHHLDDVSANGNKIQSGGEFNFMLTVHKCSQCGWGVKVTIFDTVVTCPKCGNVDSLRHS